MPKKGQPCDQPASHKAEIERSESKQPLSNASAREMSALRYGHDHPSLSHQDGQLPCDQQWIRQRCRVPALERRKESHRPPHLYELRHDPEQKGRSEGNEQSEMGACRPGLHFRGSPSTFPASLRKSPNRANVAIGTPPGQPGKRAWRRSHSRAVPTISARL